MRVVLALLALILVGCGKSSPDKPSDVSMVVKSGWSQRQVEDAVGRPTASFDYEGGPWIYSFPNVGIDVEVWWEKGRVRTVKTAYRDSY